MTLKWSGSASSYDVYLSTSSNPTTKKATTSSTQYTVSGLNYGTTYYWKVVAKKSGFTKTSSIRKFTVLSKSIPMVYVSGGNFSMGSNKYAWEKPIHNVYVNSFHIGKYEVTHEQYINFLNDKGVSYNGKYSGVEYIDMSDSNCAIGYSGGKFYFKGSSIASSSNTPVVLVSWYGAKAYCEWAGGRLPTEAEWEYAARGGSNSGNYTYSGSNTYSSVSWNSGNSGGKLHVGGQKSSNELYIYDMSGNVFEWCSDWYNGGYYSSSPSSNPKGPSSGINKVTKGGSFSFDGVSGRVAARFYDKPDETRNHVGFRLVK